MPGMVMILIHVTPAPPPPLPGGAVRLCPRGLPLVGSSNMCCSATLHYYSHHVFFAAIHHLQKHFGQQLQETLYMLCAFALAQHPAGCCRTPCCPESRLKMQDSVTL